MDFALAWKAIMPHFGKDSLLKSGKVVPHTVLIDAISIHDLPRQARFRSGRELTEVLNQAQEPQKISRLHNVWEQSLQFRLVRSAELAKIALSDQQQSTLSLGYVDPELSIEISQSEIRQAIEGNASRIGSLALEAVKTASVDVDKIFLTGGASRSPTVVEAVKAALKPGIPVVRADDFGSVTGGLTRYANDYFSARR
jgi:hypothetical chaperone protein